MLINKNKSRVYTVMELVEGIEMFEVLANAGSYTES